MQFGMPTLIENNSLIENIELCKKCGFDFVELNMNLPEYQIEQLEKINDLKSVAEHYGIYYTIHLDENLNVCDFNTAVANAYFETVKRTIDVAQKLNIPIINMHMSNGVYFTLPDRKVYLFEKYKEFYIEKIGKFIQMCSSQISNRNLKICIENTDGFPDYQKEAINLMLDNNTFGLTWDIGHSHSVNNIDESFIISNISNLKHFHIHDGLDRKNHLTLGTGEIDFKQRLDIAQSCNARCVVETKTVEALQDSSLWLKNKKYI